MTTSQTLVFLAYLGLAWLATTALDWRRLLTRALPPTCRVCGFSRPGLRFEGDRCPQCRDRAARMHGW